MNTYEEWVQILGNCGTALGQATLKRLHIHLSGIEYGPKGEREHLPVQESVLNLKAILQALKDLGCGDRIVFESSILEDDAIYIKNEWNQMQTNQAGL